MLKCKTVLQTEIETEIQPNSPGNCQLSALFGLSNPK